MICARVVVTPKMNPTSLGTVTRQVWHKVDPNFLGNSGDINFILWLDSNLKNKGVNPNNNIEWSTIFVVTIWYLWKERNNYQFNNEASTPEQIAIKCFGLAIETHSFLYQPRSEWDC